LKKATAVIPARYDSSRFPGKPLALILGKPMIQRVYEQALSADHVDNIIIATDDDRIMEAAQGFGAKVVKTSPDHSSGTHRVSEVALALESPIIINIQGDEPLLQGEMLDDLVLALQDSSVSMATLASRSRNQGSFQQAGTVKVVMDMEGYALYFSRSPIPHQASGFFWHHVGIYGYQKQFLLEYPSLPVLNLEKQEKLEQLRALEHGFRIKVIETKHATLSVDYPEDIVKVEEVLQEEDHA
jgi:3-deoxy-manno-octulosonate cytidylyltransferase (CMP-KDO synthetase)